MEYTDSANRPVAAPAPWEGEAPVAMRPLPRGPVFGWSSLRGKHDAGVPDVGGLASQVMTTSGRAAIFQALKLIDLAPRSGVLLPTYHCPTMVAPALLAGLQPVFYALGEDGLPDLAALDSRPATQAGAMLVPHLFGRTQSLAAVRGWCDAHGIALIEDCAHAFFGQAGERPVGAWGDFATASLSKFLPIPEGGLLVSATRPLPPLPLRPRRLHEQAKGWVDVAESAAMHQRLSGLNAMLGLVFRTKNALRRSPRQGCAGTDKESLQGRTSLETMTDCDMSRVTDAPLAVARWMREHVSFERIVARRRLNFDTYARCLDGVRGARALAGSSPGGAGWTEAVAPYVFPLWVDNADAVYAHVRKLRLPVFRWDRLWPGTPELPDDTGTRWSQHVLQLLCHQDLSHADVEQVSHKIHHLLASR